MTPVQIAYFKHFLYDSGIARQFIIVYQKHHFKHNPASVEEWLQKADAQQVILKGFSFQLNHAYGFDYWKEVDQKWGEYWKIHKDNFSNINYVFLKGAFGILRQNWDAPQYWAKETKTATYARMNITPPEGFIPDDEREVSKEDLSLDRTEANETDTSVSFPDHAPLIEFLEDDDPLADFEFFEEAYPQRIQLLSNEASLNFNSGSFKLTFNMPMSKEIEKLGMEYARLAKNKSGDCCLILNRSQGVRLSKSTSSSKKKDRFNTTLNSKDICTRLRTLLNIRLDYSVLNIERLPSTQDYIILKITKPA
ncbi:MAG: hypothetical protein IJ588_13725 [Prevotella sp.]|nr:hypothetical protein [Prevotella sp.]